MSYVNKIVSSNGTEYDFVNAFSSELIAAGNGRIRLISSEDENNAICRIFSIDNKYTLKMIRRRENNYPTNSYFFRLLKNETQFCNYLKQYGPDTQGPDSQTTRAFPFIVISNEDLLFIAIGRYAESAYPRAHFVINNENIILYNDYQGGIITYSTCKDAATMTEFSVKSRFNDYIMPTSNVDMMDNAVLVDPNTNVKQAELKGLYNCTRMPAVGIIYTIGDEQYYGADPIFLIKI